MSAGCIIARRTSRSFDCPQRDMDPTNCVNDSVGSTQANRVSSITDHPSWPLSTPKHYVPHWHPYHLVASFLWELPRAIRVSFCRWLTWACVECSPDSSGLGETTQNWAFCPIQGKAERISWAPKMEYYWVIKKEEILFICKFRRSNVQYVDYS